MKSFSDILHKTPWWALVVAGLACFIALAAFITPYHIIDYRNDGATPEERRAIKREIDNAFAENAIDIARNVIQGMRGSTTDPRRREELDTALEGLDEARRELRDAGSEVLRAKREALEQTHEAARSAHKAVEEARREIERVLKEGGVESPEVRKALEDSVRAAEQAEAKARAELAGKERRRVKIGIAGDPKRPLIDVEIETAEPGEKSGVQITPPAPPGSPVAEAGVPPVPAPGAAVVPPVPPVPGADVPPVPPVPGAVATGLPPEVRDQIRQDVTGDMYRIGIGAAMALILMPMFILALIAKFFIDRARGATRMAELKRKEAEYARMTQQVTEAKLQALQAQVEPHFLYNTLASVQALTEVDPAQANAMTGHLIQYLRNALPKMREGVSTVGQEIELVRAYLSILQMRMGKRLAFDIDVPEGLAALAFPPLMLPSLVENAIKHGLEPQREGGTVHIRAEQVDGKLRLIVADTGRGFGESIGAGVGLANIRERLAGLHGGAARLTLEENAPRGVVATIELPAQGAHVSPGTAPGGTQGAAQGAAQARAAAQPAARLEAPDPAATAVPRTRAARIFSALAAIERVWRLALWYTFIALVIVSAVFAVLGIFGVTTHMFPVQMGEDFLVGPGGALVGAAGILLAFVVVVIALAIVMVVIYGLGFLVAGLLLFVLVMLLVGLSPVLAPIVLVCLAIWWLLRKKDSDARPAAGRVEPTMASPAPFAPAPSPPPTPPVQHPL